MRFWRAIAAAILLVTVPALRAGEIPPDARRSGYTFMGPDTRAMQDDDTANPGMLFVLDGEALWGAIRPAAPTRPAPIAMAMRAAA
ncbi:hypothetical protein ACVWY3_003989 [Bradyrhizobium sp. USDA 4486]